MTNSRYASQNTEHDLEANYDTASRCNEESDLKSAGITPEVSANWLSKLTFSWFTSMMDKAYNSHLKTSDYYDLPEYDTPRYKLEEFMKYWEKELIHYNLSTNSNKDYEKSEFQDKEKLINSESKGLRKPSLVKTLFLTFKWHFLVVFCLVIIADSCVLAQSIVLRKLLLCMQNHELYTEVGSSSSHWILKTLGINENINFQVLRRGLYLVFLMTFLTIIFPMLKQQEYELVTNLGRYCKSLMSGFLYRKLLQMDSFEFCNNTITEQKKSDSSDISSVSRNTKLGNLGNTYNLVNLMGNDVCKFNRLITAHLFYSGTFLLFASTICLYSQLGISALFGISVVIINVLLSVTALHFRALERKPYLNYQDQRIKYTNECLSYMKIIKSYAWEDCFTERIMNCRNNEIKSLLKQGMYRTLSMSIYSTTMQATLVTSIVYTLMGNKLDPATVFFAEGLFETLSLVLSFFPFSYASFHDLILACGRIRDFLIISEKKRMRRTKSQVSNQDSIKESKKGGYVSFKNVQLYWPDGNLMLRDVSFQVKSGEIIAIIGSIGSGKTGLLSTIIGEITPTQGKIRRNGKLAYVAQIPWVQTGTIHDNILFGAPYDPIWYDIVIKACALWMDFQVLPDGDRTIIGEKGVNLSGGQRQRISLARAVYQKADVYVLDDCLSAVDSHVAAHIFKNCICGILGGKCVILVTHKLDIIPNVDQVILFDAVMKRQVYAGHPAGLSRLPAFTLQNISFETIQSNEEYEEDVDNSYYNSNFNCMNQKQSRSMPLRGFPTTYTNDSDDNNQIINTHNVYNKPITNSKDCSPYGTDDSKKSKIVDDVVAVDLLDELVTNIEKSTPNTPKIKSKDRKFEGELSASRFKVNKKTRSIIKDIEEVTETKDNVSPYFKSNKVGFIKGRTASIRMSGEELKSHYRRDRESGSIFSDTSFDFHQRKSIDKISSSSKYESQKRIIQEEAVELGSVSRETYKAYFVEWGAFNMLGILVCHIAAGFIFSRNMFWLANWTGRNETSYWIYAVSVYALYTILYSLSHMISTLLVRNGGIRASKAFHEKLLNRLRYTSLSFFETTPIGRILNRFTGDLTNLDDSLPRNIGDLLIASAKIIVITVSISKVVPKFLVCIPILACLFYQVSKKYAPMLRQSERLAAIFAAPILSHTVDTIDGLTTIRAFNAQERFIQKMDDAIRSESRIRYHVETAYRWLFVRLEIMGCIAVFTAGTLGVISVVYCPSNAGMFGAAMTFALSVSSCLNFGTRVLGEIEGVMVGLERIRDYTETTPLEPEPINEMNRPPKNWPNNGKIEFINLQLRYKPELPLVLNNINCLVKPGEKVGVVGRTGAGKSSIFISILRLVEPDYGLIKIDDINVFSIGTFDLRSRISIIPQDPIIFSGTVKFNLDPLQQHTDEEIYQVLKSSHLYSFIKSLPKGLESQLDSSGQILSAGQKQLLCLTRALLRRSKVVLLDEATSSVDTYTDSLIQKTIRTEFHNSTILAVAHRVQTVLDYDKIMVLDSGSIVEFDHPNVLLNTKNSIFYSLVHGDQ